MGAPSVEGASFSSGVSFVSVLKLILTVAVLGVETGGLTVELCESEE